MNTRFVKNHDGVYVNTSTISVFAPFEKNDTQIIVYFIDGTNAIWTFKTQKERDACVKEILGSSSDYTKERQERMKNDTRTATEIANEIVSMRYAECPSTPIKNPIIYDRSLLPAWANKAIAMDEDGRWYCYNSIPHHSKDVWACFQGRVQGIPEEYRPRWSGDWKDSLLVFEDHE